MMTMTPYGKNVRRGSPAYFDSKGYRKLLVTSATILEDSFEEEKSVVRYAIVGKGCDEWEYDLCSPSANRDSYLAHEFRQWDRVKFWVTGGDRVIRLGGYSYREGEFQDVNQIGDVKHGKKKRKREAFQPWAPIPRRFKDLNITEKVFELKIHNNPGVSSSFYQNMLPRSAMYCPKELREKHEVFLKFTEDGQFIISLSENDYVNIYQTQSWVSVPSSVPNPGKLPSSFSSICGSRKSVSLNSIREGDWKFIDSFFIYVPTHKYGLFASACDSKTAPPAGTYDLDTSGRSICFSLVSLEGGEIVGSLVFGSDMFIEVRDNHGVHLSDNKLTLVFCHEQRIMIYDIKRDGFNHKRRITYSCLQHDSFLHHASPQARLLDGDRIFIRFNNPYYVIPNLFAILNMSTMEVLSFSENGVVFYEICDTFADYFHFSVITTPSPISQIAAASSSNLDGVIRALRTRPLNGVKDPGLRNAKLLNTLVEDFGFECQLTSPSPYFDQLKVESEKFEFFKCKSDEFNLGEEAKFISGKIISFKGLSSVSNEIFNARSAKLLIHPNLPLILSVLESIPQDVPDHHGYGFEDDLLDVPAPQEPEGGFILNIRRR